MYGLFKPAYTQRDTNNIGNINNTRQITTSFGQSTLVLVLGWWGVSPDERIDRR